MFLRMHHLLLPILIDLVQQNVLVATVLGAALGMILVHPSLMSAYDFPKAVEAGKAIPYWDVFGLHINQVGYQ